MTINEEVVGVYAREKNRFENDDGDVIIGVLTDGKEIKGPCEIGDLKSGLRYRFYGHNKEHPRYGMQFQFNSFTLEKPYEQEETIAYLCQLDGVGYGTASALWDTYKDRAIEVLKSHPEQAVGITRNFNAELATKACNYLQSWEKTEHSKLKLMGLLKGGGFPKKTVQRSIEAWGVAAADVITRNPYRLIQFPGCSFGNTDALYVSLASLLPPKAKQKRLSRIKRQALCMWYGITTDTAGHTWHDAEVTLAALRKHMGSADLNPKKAIILALRGKLLTGKRWCDQCEGKKFDLDGVKCTKCKGTGGKAWMTDYKKSMSEWSVAVGIANALYDPYPVEWPELTAEHGPYPHQLEEYNRARKSRVSLLTGSPGTGKTYLVCAVAREIIRLHGADNMAICAPTGKASQRVNELLSENKVRGVMATTIHRMLGVCDTEEGGGFRFRHNAANPLPFKYVIVDEFSMCDVTLFGALLSAMRPGSHLLCVGDQNQLSPVGHGCPLRDLIRSKVLGVGELTEIQRNSGRIVQACKQIREDHVFTHSKKISLSEGENLGMIECNNPEQQVDEIVRVITAIRAAKKLDPVWDVQVLCAINENSKISRKILNERLQGLLNPTGYCVKGNNFRVDDKIINSKNNYYAVMRGSENVKADEWNDDGQVFVANGEMAAVEEVYVTHTLARIAGRNVAIRIPNAKRDESEKGSGSDWETAYAITAHKSQGSEWKLGLVVIDESTGAKMVCSREWIYTVISRFKLAVQLVGKYATARSFCFKSSINMRKTFLVERIREAIQKKLTERSVVDGDGQPAGVPEIQHENRQGHEESAAEQKDHAEQAAQDCFGV